MQNLVDTLKTKLGQQEVTKERFAQILESLYKEALDNSYEVGESLESITYDIFEAVNEIFKDNKDLKEYLNILLETILTTLDKYAYNKVLSEHQKIIRAKYRIRNLLYTQENRLEETVEAIESFANDYNYIDLKDRANSIKESLYNKIYKILDNFKYNRHRK